MPRIDRSQKEMKWDEMNIMATHHPPGKEYGHMKIDEPPTPYSKYSDPEDDEDVERRQSVGTGEDVDPESLASRLLATGPRSEKEIEEESSSSEEDEMTEEDRAAKLKFEQKRKLHYNEFQAVKLAKQLMAEEDEDEDDDTGTDSRTSGSGIEK